jgi:ribonucleoside-diphosphate reductase alpha chain
MDAFSMAISVGLQYGIPLDSYVAKFTNMRFEPAGLTDDPDIRIASSVMDYIFRRLALDHLPYDQRAELGILSATETWPRPTPRCRRAVPASCWRRSWAGPPTRRSASPAAPRCARQAAATSAKAAAPPAAAASDHYSRRFTSSGEVWPDGCTPPERSSPGCLEPMAGPGVLPRSRRGLPRGPG